MTLRYRADIDGLRAVAVTAVILYHFKIPGFTGGFVGVDVFFVISGFLISSLILRELEEQQFSLLHFYERRVRRLVPALVVLLFAVGIVASFELFPAAYLRFGQSVAATSVFLSNIEFWREADTYFGSPALEKPLLHTWSLAVEEQFYLLFPPLLMLLAPRSKSWTIAALVTLVAVSFGISIWSVFAAPQSGFFLFPARIWELLLGALIAIGAFPIASSRRLNTLLAASGIAMIAYAVAAYAPSTAYPGAAALLPCAGAGLVIYAGLAGTSALNRFLSARPIVFVGLMSYSLYLWHWPIYVFATYHLARDLTPLESASLIGASFVVATLSWRFVEQPFRRPDGVVPRRQLFIRAAAITAVLGASGIAIYLANGLPERFTPEVQTALAPQTYFRRLGCDPGRSEQTPAGIELCKLGRPGGAVTFFVWGDSHALALLPAISRAADRFGRTGLMSAIGACPPFIGSTFPLSERCLEHSAATYAFLQAQKINDVILIGRWAGYSEFSDYIRDIYTKEVRTPALTIRPGWSLEDTEHAFRREFDETVDTLRRMGLRVTIVGPVPEIGMRVPTTLARFRMWNLPEDFGPTRAEFEVRNKIILDRLAAEDSDVRLVYPDKMLCGQVTCAVTRDGKPLYFDDHHLDRFGAESISAIFDPLFAGYQ
jgi:peptidoglycan/LPS O-acetylase OafA/YrhL